MYAKNTKLKTKNSKEPSPSSFSPKEIKTACYVMDTSNIFTEGNSIVKIAEIDILKLENYKINTTSTFREQRINGRRPRLIIKIRTMNEIIEQDILILDSVREVIIE